MKGFCEFKFIPLDLISFDSEINESNKDIEEFNDDLRKIKYIKRLFNQYASEGVLKERLLLNHIIVFYNVFIRFLRTIKKLFGLKTLILIVNFS